jgi:hypothetical protein
MALLVEKRALQNVYNPRVCTEFRGNYKRNRVNAKPRLSPRMVWTSSSPHAPNWLYFSSPCSDLNLHICSHLNDSYNP